MIHFLLADAHVFILSGTWYFNSLCFPFGPLRGPRSAFPLYQRSKEQRVPLVPR